MDTNKIFHMKELLKLGYKKTQIHTVIRTRVFEGLDAAQGYANTYGLNQAVLISIGCELLSTGFSARHVDQVLFQSSSFDFAKHAEAIVRRSFLDLLVFRADAEIAYFRAHRKESKGKGGLSTIVGKNLATGEYIYEHTPYEMKMRSAPIRIAWAFTAEDRAALNGGLATCVRINVASILEALLG